MAELKLKPEVTPQVGKLLIARHKELLKDLAELERDCFEHVDPTDLHWLADKAMLAARRDQRDRTPESMAAAVEARTLLLSALGVPAADNTQQENGQ